MWALRKFNCPESYTSPSFIYNFARKKGMDYVTITDHNSINGALEIAHRPGAFVSAEITTYFPEDGCKTHVVVLDVTEAIFKDAMNARKNVHDLVAYLRKNHIVHFAAHPLYDMNFRLTVETIERMLLLFDVFEVKNGARAGRYNSLVFDILASLTREKMEMLADKHGIVPYGDHPWLKAVVGGSDDHSGFFVARAFTVSENGSDIGKFVDSIRERQCRAEGEDGDVLTLAHSIYGVGYRFYKEEIEKKNVASFPFVNALLTRVLNGQNKRQPLFEKLNLFFRKSIPEMYTDYEGRTFEEILDREAKRLLNDADFLKSMSVGDINRRVFTVVSYLANRLIFIYTQRLTKTLPSAGIISLVNSLSAIGLIHLFASPYYVAFHYQHRSKTLMEDLVMSFLNPALRNGHRKIALFTDTLEEINGVAITIKRLIAAAREQDIELVVITSGPNETTLAGSVMNFRSVGEFTLPEYPDLKLNFPPVLDVIDYFEREGFTSIHASTPGTMGLLALFISKLMDIPLSGTYHTDIPQYVRSLTNDAFLENIAWNYMIWFYNFMEEVMVPSASTRHQLIHRGLVSDKVRPLPRWVDTNVFTPAKRDPHLWTRHGLDGSVKFLYVGRISLEKNVELLSEAFSAFIDSGSAGSLIVVGDGPYRKTMESGLKGYPVLFTGFLTGEALCAAYASSDVFIFPSTTDTFGNVVLEAQASGLPVIVSDEGGPKELMKDGMTGLMIKAHHCHALIDAMHFFVEDRTHIVTMGENARTFTKKNGIDAQMAYSTILKNDFSSGHHCKLKGADISPLDATLVTA
jgi:glycosyltransferase involved in cell wall biosynthesis